MFWSFRRTLDRYIVHLRPGLLYDPEARASRLSGPLSVQIQTIDRCNASCPTCPYTGGANAGSAHLMDDRLYLRIVDGMRRMGCLRGFALMLQNEPLLDPNLGRRVRQARERLGKRTSIGTVTNGSLLTSRRIDELVEAGFDEIHVSIDAAREETYRAVRPGLDFARVVENVHNLRRRAGRTRVTARFLRQRTNEAEEREFARYWRSHGVHVETLSMSNRAGALTAFARLRPGKRSTLREGLRRLVRRHSLACTTPFLRLSVLWDGRALVCCQDWRHGAVVGDLSRQSVAEVWHGEPLNHHRHLIWSRRFDESPVCGCCSDVIDW